MTYNNGIRFKTPEFSFGFATNWCVILGKVFDITELLFLHLETNEGDL